MSKEITDSYDKLEAQRQNGLKNYRHYQRQRVRNRGFYTVSMYSIKMNLGADVPHRALL